MSLGLHLIGNSHLVSIAEAWRADPERWPGIAPVFHAFRGTTVAETRLEGLTLVPETAHAAEQMRRLNGTDRIDLAGAGAYVVVGFNFKTEHALHLWRAARWPGLPSLLREEDIAAMPVPLISRPAARAALTGALGRTTNLRLASALRRASGRRVLVIGEPRLHGRALGRRQGRVLGLPQAMRSGDGPALSALFEGAADAAAAAAGVERIAQPRQTVMRHLLSRPDYMAGEIEVEGPRGRRVRREDLRHPSAALGALMLDAVAEALGR